MGAIATLIQRREFLADALASARQRWPDVVALAVRTVFELLESPEPSLRLRAASTVLRLAGDGALPLPQAPVVEETSESRLEKELARIFAARGTAVMACDSACS
jgi:hypothetical protein